MVYASFLRGSGLEEDLSIWRVDHTITGEAAGRAPLRQISICAIGETPLTTSLARGHVSDGTALCHWASQTEVMGLRRRLLLMKGPRRDPLPILRHTGVAVNRAQARCGALVSDGVGSDPY